VNWKSSSSQAKVVGTIASILGALVIILYKGPTILCSHSPASFVHPHQLVFLLSQQLNWVLGGFLLAAEAFLLSLWFIIQVSTHALLFLKNLNDIITNPKRLDKYKKICNLAGIYPQRLPRGAEHNVLFDVLCNHLFRAIILNYSDRAAVLDSKIRCAFDRYFILGKWVISQLLKSKFSVGFEFEDKSQINIVSAGSGCWCL